MSLSLLFRIARLLFPITFALCDISIGANVEGRRRRARQQARRGRRSQSHDVRIRCTVVEEGTNIRGQLDEGGKISPSESLSAQRTFCSFVAALMLVGGVWARADCKKNSLGMVRKVRLDLEILGLRYHTSVDMLRTFTF